MSNLEYLMNKYGVRLNLLQLSEAIGMPYATIVNKRSAGTLKLRTYRDGMKIYCDTRDLVAYLDEVRNEQT